MIRDEDELYRRLHSQHVNPKTGRVRPNAYQISNKPEQEPSVEIAKMSDPQECARRDGRIGWGCGVLLAKNVRAIMLDIRHDPLPHLEAHAVLVGAITIDACRQLADATGIAIMPDMVNGSKRVIT